ncbi:RimK family alpha-L-glutamate ligase [Corallococcus silvisoli]|uniref:RimK family alpha-L-glutamate ligase n=1 Tax=Corallococcus silvisoli TaxID=2697031 RepID=UPI001377F9CF|nr:RimK family alpha-L-glutamate ligase [Corallococcus silvisoli]NBD11913.1 RimK family alpha-L-glutamate ligase [Corallococcus silvisoli]
MRKVDLVYTRVRTEEKLLLEALRRRDCAVNMVADSGQVLSVDRQRVSDADTVLMRSMSFTRARYLATFLELKGARVLNSARTISLCGDKALTCAALAAKGVPMPWAFVAFDEDACLDAIETKGYPVVTKPVLGSWGRMVARLDSRSAAEGVLAMRFGTGGAQDHVALVQEYVDKPGYDLRVYVIGRAVGGLRRRSEHWVTNTARGAVPERYEVPVVHAKLAEAAAEAVGGDMVAVDLLETRGGDLYVNEINHCVEFARSIEATGVPLPDLIADYVVTGAGGGRG